MTVSVADHYARHLGRIYSWMAGGIESALERGRAELAALHLSPSPNDLAVDLGAGFGMHAIPLARLGYEVLVIDSCDHLVAELRSRVNDDSIRTVATDLLSFPDHLDRKPALILCMGDTLTHLPDQRAVSSLIEQIAHTLDDGGRFVATFRGYSVPLTGTARFIPVRSDDTRILTCFLEFTENHVRVHDVLHEKRENSGWQLSVSSYQKLRLPPEWVAEEFHRYGFSVEQTDGPSGMRCIVARKGRG